MKSRMRAQAATAPTINYGLFINIIINFIIVALAIFIVISQVNAMKRKPAPPEPNTKECPSARRTSPKQLTNARTARRI
jgi:large conductance mechanosensitive channel